MQQKTSVWGLGRWRCFVLLHKKFARATVSTVQSCLWWATPVRRHVSVWQRSLATLTSQWRCWLKHCAECRLRPAHYQKSLFTILQIRVLHVYDEIEMSSYNSYCSVGLPKGWLNIIKHTDWIAWRCASIRLLAMNRSEHCCELNEQRINDPCITTNYEQIAT